MIGKVILGIIAIFLLIAVFATSIISGIHGWRTEDTTQQFVVTTAAAETTADITLSHDLFQASTDEVYSVTTSQNETVAATSYVEATKVLTISNLTDDLTRVVTVSYYGETEDDTMRIVGPFLGIVIFGGLTFAIVAGVFKSGKR